MNKSKHTKGEWEIATKQTELMGDYVIETCDGLTIIATVHRSPRMENSTFRDEAYENALLMATAPETKEQRDALLDALKNLMSEIDKPDYPTHTGMAILYKDMARAAIDLVEKET